VQWYAAFFFAILANLQQFKNNRFHVHYISFQLECVIKQRFAYFRRICLVCLLYICHLAFFLKEQTLFQLKHWSVIQPTLSKSVSSISDALVSFNCYVYVLSTLLLECHSTKDKTYLSSSRPKMTCKLKSTCSKYRHLTHY